MATLNNATLTTGASSIRGMRESLANYISRIDPEEVPFTEWCGSGTATNSLAHDWQVVSLSRNVVESNVDSPDRR